MSHYRRSIELFELGMYKQSREQLEFFPEPHRTDELTKHLQYFITRGWYGNASKTAEALRRKLSHEEKVQIFNVCVMEGNLPRALGMARKFGRQLSHEEKMQIFSVCMSERRLQDACEAAELLQEPQRSEALTKVLSEHFAHHRIWEAIHIADDLPQAFRTSELTRLLGLCVAKRRLRFINLLERLLSKNDRVSEPVKTNAINSDAPAELLLSVIEIAAANGLLERNERFQTNWRRT